MCPLPSKPARKEPYYVNHPLPTDSDDHETPPVDTPFKSSTPNVAHPPLTLPGDRKLSPVPFRHKELSSLDVSNGRLSSALSDSSTSSQSLSSSCLPDPNLKCPSCGKQFLEGEIQKYRKHYRNCCRVPSATVDDSLLYQEQLRTAGQSVDPNLVCVGCNKSFKEYQIQEFRRHCNSCKKFRDRSMSLRESRPNAGSSEENQLLSSSWSVGENFLEK